MHPGIEGTNFCQETESDPTSSDPLPQEIVPTTTPPTQPPIQQPVPQPTHQPTQLPTQPAKTPTATTATVETPKPATPRIGKKGFRFVEPPKQKDRIKSGSKLQEALKKSKAVNVATGYASETTGS